jgi:hypothetical protein
MGEIFVKKMEHGAVLRIILPLASQTAIENWLNHLLSSRHGSCFV